MGQTITLNQKTINFKSADWRRLTNQKPNTKWWHDIVNFLQEWSSTSETIEIQTSGSTGKPKIIAVQKKHMIASAKMTCDFFQLNEKSIGLLCLSANYIAGKMMLVRAMVSNMNLICVEPSGNPVKGLTTPVDFAAMVSYQAQHAIEAHDKFNLIQNLIIGGGQVSFALAQKLKNHSVNIFETFGMTETLSHIALKEITPIPKEYFQLLKGISIKQGTQNELIIDAPALGVVELLTNDIIKLLSPQSFIWKGRLDFIINSGGIKISPENVEIKIAHLISQQFCIIGLPDEKLGEKIVLIIEGKPFNTKALKDKIKTHLPTYYYPKEIMFFEKFPLTESGKIKRKEIIRNL